jgi:hypothetical protein
MKTESSKNRHGTNTVGTQDKNEWLSEPRDHLNHIEKLVKSIEKLVSQTYHDYLM